MPKYPIIPGLDPVETDPLDEDPDDDGGAREAPREQIRDELRARRGGGGGRRSKPRGNASFLDKYGLDNMNLFAR